MIGLAEVNEKEELPIAHIMINRLNAAANTSVELADDLRIKLLPFSKQCNPVACDEEVKREQYPDYFNEFRRLLDIIEMSLNSIQHSKNLAEL
jgi:hypothetical protein